MPLAGKGSVVVIVLFGETAISGLCIGLRFYTRKFVRGDIGVDDYVLWATWVLQIMTSVFFTISSMYGFGQHNALLSAENIMMATKIELMAQFTVSLAMGLSKAAVAVFLLRIMNTAWHKWLLWFWIFSMMFLSFLLAISCFAQCYPTQSLWDPSIPVQACPINLTTVAFVMCSWSAAMDFFLAIFPWFVLWGLNMKKKEKITICCSLSLGVFAGVCGIIRTTGLAVLSQTSDYLFATADSVMWTSSELALTIICVSIPALRPLWQQVFTTGMSSTGDQYGRKSASRYGYRSKIASQTGGPGNNDDAERGYQLNAVNEVQIESSASRAASGEGGMCTSWHEETDNNSDKSILGGGPGKYPNDGTGIMRRNEITVTYSSK